MIPIKFSLIVKESNKEHFFNKDEISIGRASNNDLILDEDVISSKHARLFFEKGTCFLQDFGSTNHTYYRERELAKNEKVPLKNGDEIRLGKVLLKYIYPVRLSLFILQKTKEIEREHPIKKEKTYIGRSPEKNDIVLNNQSISNEHALIQFDKKGFILEDLGSTNHSYHKGKQLDKGDKVTIQRGDTFELASGSRKVVLKLDESPLPQYIPEENTVLAKGFANEKKNLPIMLIGIGIILFCLVIIGWWLGRGRPPNLPQTIPTKGSYGYIEDNHSIKSYPDQVVFIFTPETGKVARLYYTAGGIDKEEELIILLNGKKITQAPQSPKWGKEQKLDISEWIKENQENQLIFRNTKNSSNRLNIWILKYLGFAWDIEKWAVKNIRVEFSSKR